MNKLPSVAARWGLLVADRLERLHAPAQLAARLYVANVFFLAGLTKIRDWDTTLALFADEYMVPFLSPALAAFGGTAGELVLPVLLVLGPVRPSGRVRVVHPQLRRRDQPERGSTRGLAAAPVLGQPARIPGAVGSRASGRSTAS